MNLDIKSSSAETFAKWSKLKLGSVVSSGWLKKQLERNKKGMGGNLDDLEEEMIKKPFRTRMFDSPVSEGWSGEISGTYYTGLVQLAFILDDEDLKAKAKAWVDDVLALQEENGYIGSYRETANRFEDYNAWSANWCYRALLSYYEAVGDDTVLKAVHRGLLWFVENWTGDKKTTYTGPVLIESMIVVYHYTGDKRLYDWCVEYSEWQNGQETERRHSIRDFNSEKLSHNDDHVVAYGENVKLPALLYSVNGDEHYINSSINGLRKIMRLNWQVNGAPSTNCEYLSPPSATHVTEYCNFATFLNTFSWMGMISGETVYGDLMEEILFNGAQGARRNDERAIAYMSSPNQFYATARSSRYGSPGMDEYAPNFKVACCPAQSVRIYPEYIRSMCAKDSEENLRFIVYGPCDVTFKTEKGNTFIINEETNYPFEGNITFSIKTTTPEKKRILFRIPRWCDKFTLKLNGNKVDAKVLDGFVCLEKSWHDDMIELRMEMKPRIIEVEDVYFKERKLQSVKLGPLLFVLPLPEIWEETTGFSYSKLPETWSAYDVKPDCSNGLPWLYSLSTKDELNIEVIKHPITDNVWVNSPVTLRIPLRYSPSAYSSRSMSEITVNAYENPVSVTKQEEIKELVPYGCSALRLACFTKYD